MNFANAFYKLRNGNSLCRASWEKTNFIRLYENEAILQHVGKGWGVWKPKNEDLLAIDWVLYSPLGKAQGDLLDDKNDKIDFAQPMPDATRHCLDEPPLDDVPEGYGHEDDRSAASAGLEATD